MKLLFDQNLSFRLCGILNDVFPDSQQVRQLGMDTATDREIWNYALAHGFTLVSQDSDYADMVALWGTTPKVIWLRCGNRPTVMIANLLRTNLQIIREFESNHGVGCLELY